MILHMTQQLSMCEILTWFWLSFSMLLYHVFWRDLSYDLMHPRLNTYLKAWFNIKMTSYQYMKSHCGDKTMLRPSHLHNGISYTGKMTSLYWIRAHVTVYLSFITWWLAYSGKYTSQIELFFRDKYSHSTHEEHASESWLKMPFKSRNICCSITLLNCVLNIH